jgi:histidine phosphotransfer protein HptB
MVDLGWNREFAFEQTGGDEGILSELMDLLRESAAEDLERIRKGLANGDCEAAGHAAHSIKGAAASLGLDRLSLLADELERAGMAGNLTGIRARIGELEEMLLQLQNL